MMVPIDRDRNSNLTTAYSRCGAGNSLVAGHDGPVWEGDGQCDPRQLQAPQRFAGVCPPWVPGMQ